jgi:hypothetical protein
VASVWLEDNVTGGRGVINYDGEWVFGPVPRGVSISRQAHHGLISVREYIFLDNDSRRWVNISDEESVPIFGESRHPFLVNTAGERVFPLEHMEIYHRLRQNFDEIIVLDENLVKIRFGNTSIGLFDLEGNEIVYFVDDDFFWLNSFVQNDVIHVFYTKVLCQVVVDCSIQYRAFDMQGNEITNRYYTHMGGFSEGFVTVSIGYPLYYWEYHGSWENPAIITIDWDNVFWGLIDKQGNEVIPTIHRHVSGVVHGRVSVQTTDGLALFNTANEVIIPTGIFNSFFICDQGVIIAGIGDASTLPSNQLKGIVCLDGNEIIPPRYNVIRNYWLSNHRYHGAINRVGQWELPERHPTFVEGRAAVAYDGLWGYIDMDGYEVVPLQFTYAGTFIDGIALVNVDGTRVRTQPHTLHSIENRIHFMRYYSAFGGTWHLIDLYGNILDTFEHEFVERISANILVFSNDISLEQLDVDWECIYLVSTQMNTENLGIIVI